MDGALGVAPHSQDEESFDDTQVRPAHRLDEQRKHSGVPAVSEPPPTSLTQFPYHRPFVVSELAKMQLLPISQRRCAIHQAEKRIRRSSQTADRDRLSRSH